MKTCSKCRVRKELNCFDKNIAMPDERVGVCKKCRVARQKLLRESRSGFDISELMRKWGRA